VLDYKVGHYVKWDNIPSEHRKDIMNTFMFVKHKYKPNGAYERTKARWVTDGANQSPNLYDLISSSMVTLTTVFIMFSLASLFKANCKSYDIKGAFLNCKIHDNKNIYVVIRKEVADVWITMDPSAVPFLNNKGELYLQLDKYLYGLKQAPLMFQLMLHDFLLSLEYQQTENDDCLFIKRDETGFSIICTHVDDLLQISTSENLINELKTKLQEKFVQITVNEPIDSYLGMNVKQNEDF